MRASYICPALTLFDENLNLDFESQAALYENLIENHIDGILVLAVWENFLPCRWRKSSNWRVLPSRPSEDAHG